jgi:hypothetical protein
VSIEWVGGLVALILGLVGGGVGWSQVKKHGKEVQKRKQAEGERDEASGRVEDQHAPDLDADQRDEFIDRL